MSTKIKILAVFVIGCLAALGFMQTGADAAAPDKIKIGLMFGMTGAASPIGPLQLDGAKLAIKEINAAGGVKIGGKGVPIEFFAKDDESKPDIAIRRFRELIDENKVDVIVGQT
jgi:branched-chain amino acid transport system substrate-binding protein